MTATDWPAARPLALGWASLALLIFGFGGWAALTPISGAIIAPGQVDVESSRQSVQHADGGTATEVLVVEGDTVVAGQTLLRLDGSELQSEFALVRAELSEVMAQRGRLEAERDDNTRINFPPDLTRLAVASPVPVALMQAQTRIFRARTDGFRAGRDQLERRRDQIRDQAHGLDAQISGTVRQLDLVDRELASQRDLLDRGITLAARVLELDRESARLEGALGGLEAARAEAESRATETGLAILQLISDRRERALAELREIVAREAELSERSRALAARIAALDIRAPVSGIVLGLQTRAPGVILAPAEIVLYIIPQDRPFVVEARISPTDVDEVAVGQTATLHLVAFDRNTTPDLDGRVTSLSADAFHDQSGDVFFYRAEIEIPMAEVEKLGSAPLIPGMPVEVFLQTGDRTLFSYLLRPFHAFFDRAFRES